MKIFIRPRKSFVLTVFLISTLLSKFSFAQNDACGSAPTITSSAAPGTCTAGTLLGSATYVAGGGVPGACGSPNKDVWFKFVAASTRPVITYTAGTLTNGQIQLFSGACGALTSIACSGTAISATGLTVGNTYFIRITSTSGANGTFTICIIDPPANDLCASAVSLTSATTCTGTTGSVINASYSGPTDCLGATPVYDVWYSFVAQATNPTITVSIGASGSSISLPKIQLFSGSCAGLVSVSCSAVIPNPGSGSINATGLTIGNTYFVRLYSPNAVPTTNGTFTICVTNPAPANDDCGGAISLIPGVTCTNTQGNVVGATLSAPVPLPICGSPVYDVWYKFVATSTVQSVTISAPAAPASMANFINPGIQLLSGACGSLSTVACNTGLTLTAPSLTIGTTYYIRVYSTSAVPASSGAFNICVIDAPANDDCNGAVSLTPAQTCTSINGTLTNSTNVSIGACNATRPDVWYSFTAQTVNPVITVGGALANMRFQVFSGTCASLTSVMCSGSASATVSPNLTIGQTYYVRVFSTTVATGNFTICVDDPPPANDVCGSAITLTSSTSCVATTATMYGATLTTPTTITGDCAGTVVYDLWYRFTAQTTNPTITLSNLGVEFTNPGMELITACGGTAIACGTTSIAANFLTPNTNYWIRVYSTSGTPPTSFNGGKFDICIVDPITPPSNDNCAGAVNLSVANACGTVNNPGNMGAATPSGPALGGSCAGPLVYDVWYRFQAVAASTSITLGSLGPNFLNPGIEVFSGNCAGLTSIACGGNPLGVPGLIVGNVYYIRVYSTTAPPPNGNARFNICLTSSSLPVVRSGNSYVNVTRKTAGGVIQSGDTLEIRMTINHTSGTMTNLRFVDNVPTNTKMALGANDFIRIITNEGLTFRQYTRAADTDPATYKASPAAGEFNVRVNVGFASGATPNAPTVQTNAATSANGQMNAASDRPKGGGGVLFAIAYKVVVTGAPGSTVTLFPAQFIYNNGTTDVTLTATPFNILISDPLNLCANSIGLNNAVEYGGTFGAGVGLNRGTDLTTPIAGYDFVNDVNAYNGVGDGRYALVNNISPRSDPIRTARRTPNCNVGPALAVNDPLNCSNRMFNGYWEIDGDHTGTNNAIGNNPPGATTASGYMLMVNADYVASEVYRQSVSNLCPNTYYEFSAWVRNICKTCGIDSAGQQFTNSVGGVPPPPPQGYPGVLPNLTFTLNNLDYYNTGEIDTVGWLKKGFVFKTGPNQTTATFSIRNNAQGGGGNDWVLDDIAIATCLPTMQYSPSITPAICQGNALQINDTVRSYFNNYTHFKWQRSTDGGNNWTDVTTPHDTTLTTVGSLYQFITSYTIPATHTTLADSGDLYRVIVATLDSNLLNSACLFTDASTIITLKVLDCGVPLTIDFISFSGKLNHGNADLIWTTSKESEPVSYSIERSYDGTSFTSIGIVPGNNNSDAKSNTYKYTDVNVQGKVWYRIAMINKDGHKKYSRIIILEDKTVNFGLTNVVNPFSTKLDFGITVSENSRVDATLMSISGKPIRKESFNVYAGANNLTINGTETLPVGMYILQIRNKDQIINKKVMKK